MLSPEQSDQIKELATQTVADILSAAQNANLGDAEIADLLYKLSTAAKEAGSALTDEVIVVEPVPIGDKVDRKPDVEIDRAYVEYQEAVSRKRRHAIETRPSQRGRRIPLRSSVRPIERDYVEPVTDTFEEVDPLNAEPKDPIAEMFEVHEGLPHISDTPILAPETTDSDERIKKITLNPRVRARVASQLSAEAGKGNIGRFVRVVSDQIGLDALDDSTIIETLLRINGALETATKIYVDNGEDYVEVSKSEEMQELAAQYPEVRDLLRYWKRLTYELPINSNIVIRNAEGRIQGGTWSPQAPISDAQPALEDAEWIAEMRRLDYGLDRIIYDIAKDSTDRNGA